MTDEKELKFSVVIPVYNMEKTIGDTIASVLNQTYQNFEIIVQDNNSVDKTAEVIRSFFDPRIKYFKNDTNIGYGKNLIAGWKNCSGDVIYYLCADDVLSKNALLETNMAFQKDEGVGAVTRPYFWFHEDINKPVRVTPMLNRKKDEIVGIKNFSKAVIVIHNEVLGQLSGLAFRKKYLKESYFTTCDEWIPHGYPFLHIFKNYPVVFLKNCQVAVRIGHNNIRKKGNSVYAISPTIRWISMINEILTEKEHQRFKKYYINNVIAVNFIGLVQIKCYASFSCLLREIWYLLKYRWLNILDLKFWFFSLGCIIVPSSLLAKMVDWYKNKINSKSMRKLYFEYDTSKI